MPLALVLLALSLAATVLLGPLGVGVLVWRVSPIGLNQTYGADGASLVVVAPAAVAAAWLWHRHSRVAPPLALGIGLATLYYAVASVMGADYVRYPGNNERFFLLLLVVMILSWTIAARAWSALREPQSPPPWLARSLAVVLLLGGAIIGLAWLKQILDLAVTGAFSSPTDSVAYVDAPGGFWIVRIVDLGFIVPLSLATGVGLLRGRAGAVKAAYGVTAFLALQAIAVLAMGTIMLLRQDPGASPGLVLALAPITVALVVLTGMLFATPAGRRELPVDTWSALQASPTVRT
jgi:hypothetical protein